MGFMDAFSSMFGDPSSTVDIRSPEMRQQEQMRLSMGRGLASEYQRASGDPQYGMLPPDLLAQQENEIARSVRDRTGSGGAGGSGYETDMIRKAIIDFRIQQLARRQQSLDSLRSGMIYAMGGGQPLQQAQPQPPGIGRAMGQQVFGRIGQRGGMDISDALFGPPPNPGGGEKGNPQHGERVNQPGTTPTYGI